MKAVLDHVGVAAEDLAQAVAFYRDALGLEVRAAEDVPGERVRVQLVPVGGASIELIEATAPDSPIARFVSKRGPGLHHITLRVDDLRAALAHLASRGVRLVDAAPRAGAGGAPVAFVHPAASHGVLIELKEAAARRANLAVHAMAFGDLRLTVLHDGPFWLDGGAMFGVVPRTLWEKQAPPDDLNRIPLAMRPLLVEADWGRMIVDCGAGDKMDARQQTIYGLDRARTLEHALAEVGLSSEAIDFALATHLHFDHFGGATVRRNGSLVPRFPKATCLIRSGEWQDATRPHERNRASYLPENLRPLQEAGVIAFVDADGTLKPGVRVVRTGGHTAHHQIVFLESAGRTAVFVADLIPTVAHVHDAWIMGYDLFPMDTLAFKKRFVREAIDREYLVVFEHDPEVLAGYIRERDGRRYVERVC